MHLRKVLRVGAPFAGAVVGAVFLLPATPALADGGGISIPLISVPLKSGTVEVPLTISSSSVLIGRSYLLQVGGSTSILTRVTPQIAGAACSYSGGPESLWDCSAPAGGWTAGTIELTMPFDASGADTYLGYLSLEGKDYEVLAGSPQDSAVAAAGGYTFDFAGTTPPPRNAPTTPTPSHASSSSYAVASGESSPAHAPSPTTPSPTTPQQSQSSNAASTSAAAAAPDLSSSRQTTVSPTRLPAESAASTHSSSSSAPTAAIAAVVALLLAGGVGTGLLTKRRHRARTASGPNGSDSEAPKTEAK